MPDDIKVILRPEQVVLLCHGVSPETLHDVAAVSIKGGSPLESKFRGYKAPETVGLVLRDGSQRSHTNVQVVMIKGGSGQEDSLVGGGGTTKQMIVDDSGVGLGQINNIKTDSKYIDEIDKYLVDKAKATHEAGGDEFYGRIGMQKQEVAALNAAAPFTRTSPLSALGGMMGNQATVTSGSAPIMVANWQGDDADLRSVTITVAPVLTFSKVISNVSPLGRFRPFATIIFGTKGSLVSVDVDIGQGCQFTVTASSVAVKVGMDPVAVPGTAPGSMILLGMISFGMISRPTPITRTIYYDKINNDAYISTPIPVFAKKVSYQGTGVANLYIRDADGCALVNFASLPATDLTTAMEPFTIFGGAAFAYWNCVTGGTGTGYGALVFDLVL